MSKNGLFNFMWLVGKAGGRGRVFTCVRFVMGLRGKLKVSGLVLLGLASLEVRKAIFFIWGL
jgi:hypothetical protein